MPETVGSWQEKLENLLALGSATPRQDAQVLLANALGKDRSWIMAHPEVDLNAQQERQLQQISRSIKKGLPLPYILGRWEFFGLEFMLSPQVLIPRPETELLVEQALEWLLARPDVQRALDMGTGSGCIAISLAVRAPTLHVTAVDASFMALKVARANAKKHAVSQQIDFVQADLGSPMRGQFDLVCANLPYIPSAQLNGLPVARHEPLQALDGGEDGLEIIRRFLCWVTDHLAVKSLVLVEIEASQGAAAKALAVNLFPEAQVTLLVDLAGKDRLVRIERE